MCQLCGKDGTADSGTAGSPDGGDHLRDKAACGCGRPPGGASSGIQEDLCIY